METINTGTETVKEAVSILSRVRSGKPLYEIAAEEKISIGEASMRLNAELLQEKKNRDAELNAKIIARYEKGIPAEEISKEFDIPYGKIKKIIFNSGSYQNDIIGFSKMQKEQFNEENPDVANTLSLKEREERNNAVAEAFSKGKNIREIAKQFYLKAGMVYFILRNKGIPVNKTGSKRYKQREAPNRSYDYEFVQNAIGAYREIKNIRKTAEKLNVRYDVIYKILRKNHELESKIYRKELLLLKKPEVINEIKNAHEEQLTITEMSARVGMSRYSVKKFLTENNLAIYKNPTVRKKNKKSVLTAYLQARAKSLGRAPYKKELLKDKVHNYMQYYRAFGSYKKAIEAARLKSGSSVKKETRISYKAELLNELKRIAGEINKAPDEIDLNTRSTYPVSEFNKNFGSLKSACRRAGMEIKQVPVNKTTNEELIAYLRDLAHRCGSTPTIALLNKDKRYNNILFSRRFGSWNIALLTAGFTPTLIKEKKPVNREELLVRVKEYIKQHGTPAVRTLQKDCKITEFNLYYFFGGYRKLIKEATERG